MSFGFLFYTPFLNRSGFGREHGANEINLPLVRFVFTGIAFLFNLAYGLVGYTIELEFEDIDIIVCLHNAVYPSVALHLFRVHGVDTDQAHDEIERVVAFSLRRMV